MFIYYIETSRAFYNKYKKYDLTAQKQRQFGVQPVLNVM